MREGGEERRGCWIGRHSRGQRTGVGEVIECISREDGRVSELVTSGWGEY